MKDYSRLTEITVKSQEEFNEIPDDFKGRIYIQFGTYFNKAIINRKFYRSVVARENSSVVARENSSVEARENSSVVARENSSVEAWENSSVVAWGNSSVVAWENSSVVASANAQIVDRLRDGKIEITGNARIVYMPKNIEDFMNFYGIKHDKKKATFFKAVRNHSGKYLADYDNSFEYKIGEVANENCNPDTTNECGRGIHIAHLAWALDFGKDWGNLSILELEVDIDTIVLPEDTSGKVRTSEVKVIREVPLEECGVYGKILAKRRK